MFEEPDGQDAIWRNQKECSWFGIGEKMEAADFMWYPLSRFTLEQLMNVTRLQVEEESEMSLSYSGSQDSNSKNINKDDG
nr:hypothetical protein [Tanacetum cinerariifolium]